MAPYPGFVGQAYTTRSTAVSANRCINLYPETVNADAGYPAGKAPIVVYRTPGLGLLQTLPDGPIRGEFEINGRAFVVAGATLFEVGNNGTSHTTIGTVANSTEPAQMVATEVQLLVLSAGLGYIYNMVTGVFSQILADAFPNPAVACTTIDTYMIVLHGGTNQFFISAPLDGTVWSGLDFSSDEEPDTAVTLAQNHLYLWIFGQNEIVIYQDSGGSAFPFTRIPGSQIEQGCAALNSVITADNTLMWLGKDPRGAGVFYRGNGFLPDRISDYGVEFAISQYSTVADCIGYSYQDGGHLFCVWSFPTANATWVYDVGEKKWHERLYFSAGQYSASRARFHMFAFGMHIVGDYTNGNLYEMSEQYPTDNGAPIRWLRSAPHLSIEDQWLFYSQIQIDMQTGSGTNDPSYDPQVVLRASNDGGYTWGNEQYASCGATGQYNKRVIFNRQGRSRNRVFELSGSDPVQQISIINAYLTLQKGAG